MTSKKSLVGGSKDSGSTSANSSVLSSASTPQAAKQIHVALGADPKKGIDVKMADYPNCEALLEAVIS